MNGRNGMSEVRSEVADRILSRSFLPQNTLSHFFGVDLYHPL
jgi:hypothetical protein